MHTQRNTMISFRQSKALDSQNNVKVSELEWSNENNLEVEVRVDAR